MRKIKLIILALLVISLFLVTGCAPKSTMSNLMKEKGYSEQPQDAFNHNSMLNVELIQASANVDPNYAWQKTLTANPGDFESYAKKIVTWRIEGKSYFSSLDEFNEVSKSIHPIVQKHLQDKNIILKDGEGLYYYTLKSFAFDKDIVTSNMNDVMSVVLDDQKTKNIQPILLVGYADEVGTKNYNVVLSESRAKALKTEFEKIGIDTSNLKILAGGETTDYGPHQENRRGILVAIVKQ